MGLHDKLDNTIEEILNTRDPEGIVYLFGLINKEHSGDIWQEIVLKTEKGMPYEIPSVDTRDDECWVVTYDSDTYKYLIDNAGNLEFHESTNPDVEIQNDVPEIVEKMVKIEADTTMEHNYD